jgi:Zn-dependent protease with chaperone function
LFRPFFAALFALLLLVAGAMARADQSAAASPAPPTDYSAASHAAPATTAVYALPPDKLAHARTLGRIRTVLGIADALWGIAFLWIFLATGWAARLSAWTVRLIRDRWLQGLLFFAIFFVVSAVASLPLDLIGHTVSLHYGISVQGWLSWAGDQGKGLALSVVFGSLVLLLFNWLVKVLPRFHWLAIWAVFIPLVLAGIFATPLVIDPLFNKFEPLTVHHADLAAKLETVVARTGNHIPPERMFLMKASAKSNGVNAYVTGIGTSKRFVMWDTTTDRMPTDEVMFIFGHESGHYVLNHIPKLIGGMIASMFFVFWFCSVATGKVVAAKAASWRLDASPEGVAPTATRPGFLVLLLALSIVSFVTEPVSNAFSRHFEHQADVYGQEAIHGLVPNANLTTVSAFNHLGEAWLEDPDPNPIVEFWEYNHPSVQKRATFAAQYDPWAQGGHGEFFAK